MLDPVGLATLVMLMGLGIERACRHIDLCAGVRSLEVHCNQCCDFGLRGAQAASAAFFPTLAPPPAPSAPALSLGSDLYPGTRRF